jgi:hypothetical protein
MNQKNSVVSFSCYGTPLPNINNKSNSNNNNNNEWRHRYRILPTLHSSPFLAMGRGRQRKNIILSSNNENNDDEYDHNSSIQFSETDTPSSTDGVDRRNFVAVVSTLLLTIPPILLEVYSRIGSFFVDISSSYDDQQLVLSPWSDATDPSLGKTINHITIVFHGAGGQDGYTDELMTRLRDYDNINNNRTIGSSITTTGTATPKELPFSQRYSSYIVDWSAYSTNLFQASYNGEKIGRDLAQRLLQQQPHLRTVHLIGISVGSFAANAAAMKIKQVTTTTTTNGGNNRITTTNPPFVQLTLLDPFTQRGILGFGYGNRNFGKFADYTEQYLNTDDPVPSTNTPLDYAVCYDVTNLRPDTIFGHDWPLVYYARSKTVGQIKNNVWDNDSVEGQPQPQQRKAGSVIKLFK